MNRKVQIVKRAVDVVASAIGLVLAAPILLLVAAAIRLDSAGPALYRQRRAGMLIGVERQNGRQHFRFAAFEMWKFRTMCVDAEERSGAVLSSLGDPRVTRVGRFLRRTRLDEFPQLWNVLRGDMSLVGPRPERPELLDDIALAIPMFEERMREVKPGLTGFAQIHLGYTGEALPGTEIARLQDALVNPYQLEDAKGALADDMRLKLLYDLAYVASLDDFRAYVLTEAEIILKTPFVMLRGIGR